MRLSQVFTNSAPSFFFFLLFWSASLHNLNAQASDDRVPVSLESPYNTVLVHLFYLQPDTYEPALAGRVFYGITDSARASRLAIQLKQVLDGEGLYVPVNRIPKDPDYLDSVSLESIYRPFPMKLPEVYVEKIEGRWYYSGETVSVIPKLHRRIYPLGADLLLNLLPNGSNRQFLGLYLWQILGVLIVLAISILVNYLLRWILRAVMQRLSRTRMILGMIPVTQIRAAIRFLSVWLTFRLLLLLLPPLQFPVKTAKVLTIGIKLMSIFLLVMVGLKLLDMLWIYFRHMASKTESKLDEQLLPIGKRVMQAVIVMIGVIGMLPLFNFKPTALLAGLGIGGLAIALAAQDMLKNLFGSLTIFLDRPFQIGDWINFSGVDGTVEEVGLRSTRVRTFANSLVYVPNGKLSDMVVNNYSLRIYRRFFT